MMKQLMPTITMTMLNRILSQKVRIVVQQWQEDEVHQCEGGGQELQHLWLPRCRIDLQVLLLLLGQLHTNTPRHSACLRGDPWTSMGMKITLQKVQIDQM